MVSGSKKQCSLYQIGRGEQQLNVGRGEDRDQMRKIKKSIYIKKKTFLSQRTYYIQHQIKLESNNLSLASFEERHLNAVSPYDVMNPSWKKNSQHHK